MIAFSEALEIVLQSARPLGTERVPLADALQRVLAQDLVSDVDMPPFKKSAMDGYACRREDLAQPMTVVETIPAGVLPQQRIGPNQCAKIMTGAMVPEGADCVYMVEFSDDLDAGRVRFTGTNTRDNICLQGEDVCTGDIVLSAGQLIAPQHIALLAAAGCTQPLVSRRPNVGVIATGSELVEPSRTPAAGKIRDTNSSQLAAQVTAMGLQPTIFGIAEDTEERLTAMIAQAQEASDVLLLSGGVSMGDFDLVPGVLRTCGFELRFDRVAVKPGKPTTFGVAPTCVCFGLPGNPVSTFAILEVVVKPFLYKMMGHDYRPPVVDMPLGVAIRRRKTDRTAWMPVRRTELGVVLPVEYHGSAHSQSLCQADGLISVPHGVAEIPEGEIVRVRQI